MFDRSVMIWISSQYEVTGYKRIREVPFLKHQLQFFGLLPEVLDSDAGEKIVGWQMAAVETTFSTSGMS